MKRRAKNSLESKGNTILDHVRELRGRLLIALAVFAGFSLLAFFFYEPILDIIRAPLNAPLYYTTPTGSFTFLVRICAVAGIAATVPLLIYQLVMFIRPAYSEILTMKRAYLTTLYSALLAMSGILFGFLVVIPGALNFFGSFQVDGLNALISADSYLSFVTNVIVTFVFVFQIPLLITLADQIKPIPPKSLLKGEKWVIVGSLIISLMVPFAWELTTALLIATPIVALYNIAIVLVIIQQASRRRRDERIERKQLKQEKKQPTHEAKAETVEVLESESSETVLVPMTTTPQRAARPLLTCTHDQETSL